MKQSRNNIKAHKAVERGPLPKVSLILLDWTCRERFFALDWLSKQDVPREEYEIIWVELYDRVVPEAMEKADVVITCGQKGRYHKHAGYNAGLLKARGEVITVCDSDAVFPPDFITSIKEKFNLGRGRDPKSIVLMHYERRTNSTYPDGMTDIKGLDDFEWVPLWHNVGACVSVRYDDAVRFGGFDEHESFRGYICGPYELAWRLVNAGIPEEWHDPGVTLWHFMHANIDNYNIRGISFDALFEIAFMRPHLKEHAFNAVEAFSTGRLLPLNENPKVHDIRMSRRKFGSSYEKEYATKTGPEGFSRGEVLLMRVFYFGEFLREHLQPRFPLFFKAYGRLMDKLLPGSLMDWWIYKIKGASK
ncbi:MAG: glycosyltransferase [Deltaproteobacteria bacterium]|nr:glycosyltransferase [Deltaproteobacteria bacterium]